MQSNAFPPVMDCPFCEKRVEIVTLQRDAENTSVCILTYYHPDGDQHFIQYTPNGGSKSAVE